MKSINFKLFLHFVCVFFLLILTNNVNCRTARDLRLNLEDGSPIVGRYLKTFHGAGIRAFIGIPYAKPPVGDLRFSDPQPADPWKKELKTVKDAPWCTQRSPFERKYEVEGQEDCLYLNVYTPQNITKEFYPVMVFFHGGGWMMNAGGHENYGPEYLLDKNVVFVSGNYRLGPLGFLSTDNNDCPGNFGLKDQVQILRWVQKNIYVFRGNKNSVTIFGESAGGATTTYLMVSPLAEGLFHRAISESGTYFNPWAQPAHPGVARNRSVAVGKMLNCPLEGTDWKGMISCLRTRSAEEITKTFYDFFEWDFDPMVPFPPVVESDKYETSYLIEHPRHIRGSHGLKVPLMIGLNLDEGAMKSGPMFYNKTLYANLKANWKHAMAVSLYYHHHSAAKQDTIGKRIQDFYFDGYATMDDRHLQNLTNVYSDSWFFAGIDEYVKRRLEYQVDDHSARTYLYLLAQKGAASFTEIFEAGTEEYYGVCHADELQYLFPVRSLFFPTSVPSPTELKVRDAIIEFWTNFAKYGNPTPPWLRVGSLSQTTWYPTVDYPMQYLRIGSESQTVVDISMHVGLMQKRADFWRKLDAHAP